MRKRFIALSMGWLGCTSAAFGVEGALGRSVSGTTVTPYQGIIPSEPGWVLGVAEIYYSGDIGGSSSVPLHGNLALDVKGTLSFTPLTVMYVWDTPSEAWDFASAIVLPVAYAEIEATVTAGSFIGQRKENKFGLYDLAVTPLTACYHFSKTDHLSLGLTVWAPTGEYREGALANLSTNNWTFVPTVAYTKIVSGPNIELTAQWGVQFYTQNEATDYQTGVVSDLEFAAIKRWGNGFGFGVVGSWIDQMSDDEGPTANALDGFSGRAFGVGPLVTYSTKVCNANLSMDLRWIQEFENERMLEGDAGMLNVTLKF